MAGRIAILAAAQPPKTVLTLPGPSDAKVILAGHETNAPGEVRERLKWGRRAGSVIPAQAGIQRWP
ncbi:MAG TPA: hypothetical protein VFE24_12815 [Pirellulales bacterium]|nr:hypothetical protein [Pirellulales bacterium]